jgi:2'-5' RNA ligase
MVPPHENEYVWEQVSAMRRILQDPGFYRWPPHANLLYPFLELGTLKKDPESRQTNLQEIVTKLQNATSQCPPFRIQLRQFGTFGGKQRGVLWLDPESFPLHDESSEEVAPPLIQLQSRLEEAFPSCQAQSQKSNTGFTPHMTLSHFETLEAAKAAQELISMPSNLEFVLDRIYLLERIGDDGQFLRVAEIGLGEEESSTKEAIFDPPAPFPGMPATEEDWVYEERMKLKSRRNGKGRKNRRKQQRRRRSWTPRVPDTPEVIAAKQAERKAKRERLEREQGEKEAMGEV